MKKILLLIILLLFVFSCDPERVFVDPVAELNMGLQTTGTYRQELEKEVDPYFEEILAKDFNSATKIVSYKGHEFLVFYYFGGRGDIEVIELKDML